MSGNIEVNTAALRSASVAFEEAQGVLHNSADRPEAALGVGSAAWGPDKFGSTFADGEQGFLAVMADLADRTRRVAASFEQDSGGTDDASKVFVDTEEASAQGFSQA